jgi:uncharacterized protein (TIGR02757 family)
MVKDLLEEKYRKYNTPEFITGDPISVPHLYSRKENIEIAGILTALLAWGQRNTIIRNARRLLQLMDNDPCSFILHAEDTDLELFDKFVHRTFNGIDARYCVTALQNIYRSRNGLHAVFREGFTKNHDMKDALEYFRTRFFELPHPSRTEKHIADVTRGAAAKRLNMFLRWMVRKDDGGVDFGLWDDIPASALYIPLDMHTGRMARALGLLKRKQDDWKAVGELTDVLKKMDPDDPVKYDFALFGMGIYEEL